jgi:hypothetical protein
MKFRVFWQILLCSSSLSLKNDSFNHYFTSCPGYHLLVIHQDLLLHRCFFRVPGLINAVIVVIEFVPCECILVSCLLSSRPSFDLCSTACFIVKNFQFWAKIKLNFIKQLKTGKRSIIPPKELNYFSSGPVLHSWWLKMSTDTH